MTSRQVIRAAARQAAKRVRHDQMVDRRVAKRFRSRVEFLLATEPPSKNLAARIKAIAAGESAFRAANAYPEAVQHPLSA